jgi:hypothetical protein
MEMIHSPKHQFGLGIYGMKSHKGTTNDTTVKASQRTALFNHKLHPSMERLINSDFMVTQMWNPITPRKTEDGDDIFSETL